MIFSDCFKIKLVITPKLKFFPIFVVSPTCFDCFLLANTTNKYSLHYRMFAKSLICNTEISKPVAFDTATETWNLRDRDAQNCVSRWVTRPRRSLGTPSLLNTRWNSGMKIWSFWPFWLCLQNHRLFWHVLTGFNNPWRQGPWECVNRAESAARNRARFKCILGYSTRLYRVWWTF